MNKVLVWSIGIFAVLLLVGGLFLFSPVFQSTLGGSGNVWCDNFDWYCCQETQSSASLSVNSKLFAVCPASASRCVVTNVQSQSYVYFGSVNCRLVSSLFGASYKCDDQVSSAFIVGAQSIVIPKGSQVWSDRATTLSLTTFGSRLAFTGASAEALAGIPVSGSSNCVWDTSLRNPSGGAIGSPYSGTSNPLSLSYTVPVNQCVLSKSGTQFLCGNIFDECSSDSDCSGYPLNGNQVCSGGGTTGSVVHTYRCLPKGGLPSGVSKVGDKYVGQPTIGGADSTKYSGTGKVCTIDQTLDRDVSCCPSSNICGSNAFCDSASFTCVNTVECSVTSDCNQAPSCDFVNLKYKTPTCLSDGSCGFKSVNVDCCADQNCPSTQTCDTSVHKCVDKTVVKSLCAFDCCVDDSLYVDRACPSSQFCVNHACSATAQCVKASDCVGSQLCVDGVCKVVNNDTCSDSLGGLVRASITTTSSSNIFTSKTVAGCSYNYTGLIVAVSFVLILTAILIFGLRKGGKKSGGKSAKNFLQSKSFWIVFAVTVAVILLVLYFKFVIWIALGLLALLILDAIFLKGKIRKAVLKIFGW